MTTAIASSTVTASPSASVSREADRVLNLQQKDPFAEADASLGGAGGTGHGGYVHIRIMQRTARKKLTTCEGLPENINFNKILRALRKNFNCNGNVVEHPELGKVIQLQGDHRDSLVQFLTVTGICQPDGIKVHGAT